MPGGIEVSVIVPCYNGERYLDQCLESISRNTSASIEVICVNDGSRDSSLAIMHRHADKDSRFRVIDKANSGYGASVNRGIDEARGRYIAIVECDDYVKPRFYDDLVEFADSFPQHPQIVKTPYARVVLPDTPSQRVLHCKYYGLVKELGRPFTLVEQPWLVHYHPSIWSALYDREFLDAKGIRMREIPGAGWVDNPFLLETMLQAERIVYLNREYYCYREDAPGSSSVSRNADTVIDRWNDMQDIVERLHVSDEALVASHVWHAFAFIAPFAREAVRENGPLGQRVAELFARIDPGDVWDNRFVSNSQKKFYAKVLGLDCPSWDKGAHYLQLATELARGIRHDGTGFVRAYVDSYLAARRNVDGKS